MIPAREPSAEMMRATLKLLQDGKSAQSVGGDAACSQSAGSETWSRSKQNRRITKDQGGFETENSEQ